jgi:uncharacterized membrane protein
MKKTEFIENLRKSLKGIPASSVAEIVADYEEHFAMGMEAGKSEREIAAGLGDPKSLAQSHLATEHLARAEASKSLAGRSRSLLQILGVLAILAPLNFLILIGPMLALLVALLSLWAVALGILGAGLGGFGYYMASLGGMTAPFAAHLSLSTLFSALTGWGLIFILLGVLATRGVLAILLSYIRWNMNFALSRKEVDHV